MDFREDYYSGLKGLYFYKILDSIIEIAGLEERNVKILDFGCGLGKLKQRLGEKVIGYDVIPKLSEVKDWRKASFDVVVANGVFYLFTKEELRNFLAELYKANPRAELIAASSRQGILNKILTLVFKRDALEDAKLGLKDETEILKEKMEIMKEKNVFFLCNVRLLKFKN